MEVELMNWFLFLIKYQHRFCFNIEQVDIQRNYTVC